MKRSWLSAMLAVAVTSAAVLAAQNPDARNPNAPRPPGTQIPGAQAPSTQAPAATSPSQGKVIVTGCIEKGDQATAFILANATMGAAKPDTPGGAAATGTTGVRATRYTLVGKSDDVSKHEGHRVEITGTIAPAAPSPSGAPSAQSGAQAAASAAQRLQVESIKMVAAECK